jgi:hypothetical protein
MPLRASPWINSLGARYLSCDAQAHDHRKNLDSGKNRRHRPALRIRHK